jgi:hypothetical protein
MPCRTLGPRLAGAVGRRPNYPNGGGDSEKTSRNQTLIRVCHNLKHVPINGHGLV